MNHATGSAVKAVAAYINRKISDVPEHEDNLNVCNGEYRAPFTKDPDNVFTCWDAWVMFSEGTQGNYMHKEDSKSLASRSFKNVDCPVCRVMLDAALEGKVLKAK
jgi:hypothetical protein